MISLVDEIHSTSQNQQQTDTLGNRIEELNSLQDWLKEEIVNVEKN